MQRLLERLNYKKTNKRSKEGSEAIGTALSAMFIMMLIMIPIGIFVYLMPRITLEQDIQQFSNSVRLDGFVDSSVYGQFEQRMLDKGYSINDLKLTGAADDWLKVYAVDIPPSDEQGNYRNGINLIQSDTNPNPPVISRGRGKIAIEVTLPANSGLFTKAVDQTDTSEESEAQRLERLERIKDKSRYYKIGRVIMSEAYSQPGGS